MTYQDLLNQMLSGWETYYQQVMNGDFSAVCWKEGHHETYGTYDTHSTDRLKLCSYILYCHKEVPEEILLRLFGEECQNLETNSFQGIGDAIKILTVLLSVSENHYPELFERVKNANFDCHCGYEYETELFRRTRKEIPDFNAEDCLSLAYDTGETEYALQFLEIVKSEYVIKDKSDCRHLIWWNEQLGRTADNEPLLKKSLAFSVKENNEDEIISAHYNLLKFYTEQKKFQEAYQEFEILSAMDLSGWYGVNLFRFILESSLDLINAGIPEANAVWNWAEPHLKRELKNSNGMYGNLYAKAVQASEKMNPGFARKVQKQYDLWKKIKKIS